MVLKAVLFDFNGVILDDESIHESLIRDVMLSENLRCSAEDFREYGLGRSDRACFQSLFELRGRFLNEDSLTRLIEQKRQAYRQTIETLNPLPIFPGVQDLVQTLQAQQLKLAVVSGALRSEIEFVLDRAGLAEAFSVIVAGDDITTSKPQPDGYLKAIARLNEHHAGLNLTPAEGLVIEDTFAGIQAAHTAGIPVVGVAHTYPFHMLQRCTNWTIDELSELEIDRILTGDDPSSKRSEAADPPPPHE